MTFKTIADMPEWAQEPIRRLVLAGFVSGTGTVTLNPGKSNADRVTLDMPETMMRMLIISRNMLLNQDKLR